MKNVLVIVYYFPPMGGSGVQRPLKFVKYLREFGWNPIVLCPDPGAYHVFDDSLQKELDELNVEVYRVKAKTPFHFFAGNKNQQKLTISDKKAKVLRKVSKLFYYPDNKKAWINPAFQMAKDIISSRKIDVIFSSAPPFSNHILAAKLKRETGLPTALDYRDSWLDNHFMTGLFGWQKKIMKAQERECLEVSDTVIGLDKFMVNSISEHHQEIKLNPHIITHGFDPKDFESSNSNIFDYKKDKLNILYSGLFYESNQPDIFLISIKELIDENKLPKEKIHLHFQGGLDKRISQLIQSLELEEISNDYGYLSHHNAVSNLKKADLLWMISNFSKDLKQVKSGKLFEYFGSGKPILGLVHPGSASNFLEEYKSGFSTPPDYKTRLKEILYHIFKLWETNKLPQPNKEFISKFNRRTLTSELASIFNVISSE